MLLALARKPRDALLRHARSLALQKFPVPSMGDSISEGTVIEFPKAVGEYVGMEEVIFVSKMDARATAFWDLF